MADAHVQEAFAVHPQAEHQGPQRHPTPLVRFMDMVASRPWCSRAMDRASSKDRVKVRRNVETAIQQLTDLGVVVEEWPGR